MLPSLLATLALAAPQEDASEILAGLIERTNGYEAFHLTYEVVSKKEGEEDETALLELTYEAPEAGRMRMSVEGSTAFDMTLQGDVMYVWRPDTEEWRRARAPAPTDVVEQLEASFPSNAPLEPGIAFRLQPGPDASLTLSANRMELRRRHLLGWLGAMAALEDEVEVVDGELLWRTASFEMLVSSEHGFPLRIQGSGERDTVFRLLEAELDEACDREALAVPREAADAPEDDDLSAYLRHLVWTETRAACFQRVQSLLDRGELSWGGLTETRWSTVLELLHRPRVEALAEERLHAMAPGFQQAAESLRESLERDRSGEALELARRQLREARERLAASFDSFRSSFIEALPALRGADDLRPELLELEDELLGDLLDELVKGAVLAAFDEATNDRNLE